MFFRNGSSIQGAAPRVDKEGYIIPLTVYFLTEEKEVRETIVRWKGAI